MTDWRGCGLLHALIRLAAFLGLPLAGLGILVFLREIPRLAWGGSQALMLAPELAAWLALAALFIALRWSLAAGPEPWRPAGLVLDFLALRALHAAVWVGLVLLVVLPGAWFLGTGNQWLVKEFAARGLLALRSGDVHDGLDGLAAAYQFSWTGGPALLFGVHLVQRWQPRRTWLAWSALPFFILLTALSMVVLVTLAHFGP